MDKNNPSHAQQTHTHRTEEGQKERIEEFDLPHSMIKRKVT
jgi:hypothetical protein